jgi:hypothetical protein
VTAWFRATSRDARPVAIDETVERLEDEARAVYTGTYDHERY